MRTAATFFGLILFSSTSFSAEPTLTSGPRLLTLADVGKVFVSTVAEPHPNFGRYLVLTSVDDSYGFDTFNLENDKAIGKLHVGHVAGPYFREVRIDRKAMTEIWTAIRIADEEDERRMAAWRKTLPGGDPTRLPEKPKSAALELGEISSYSNLIARPNPDGLLVEFNPALVAVLLLEERKAGRALTQREVNAIRDKQLVIAVLPAASQLIREKRRYDDVDPSKAWDEWQKVRLGLLK